MLLRPFFYMTTIHRYLLKGFLNVLLLCLAAAVSLFLVFDLFDRIAVFIKEGVDLLTVLSYLFYKIPLVIQLMMPVAVLIATLLSIGRLSQLSEITAMRASGMSLLYLVRPLLYAGLFISLLMFAANETIVPWATQRVQEIYHIDVKKKVETGKFSRENFWYREQNKFFNIGLYDSRSSALKGVSIFELDGNFRLVRRTDAKEARWGGNKVGWTMESVVELAKQKDGALLSTIFKRLPLVIDEEPADFYNMEKDPESLSFTQLKNYIEKLKSEGVPVTNYLVRLAAKVSFPFVNFIVVLIAFPFALIPARSGNLTASFIAGVTIGFGYYIVHAVSISFGSAELLPVIPCAWTANILLGSIGGYLLAGAEHKI